MFETFIVGKKLRKSIYNGGGYKDIDQEEEISD
jgi:hypothetical protein